MPGPYLTAEDARMYQAQARYRREQEERAERERLAKEKAEMLEKVNLVPMLWEQGFNSNTNTYDLFFSWPVEDSMEEIQGLLELQAQQIPTYPPRRRQG